MNRKLRRLAEKQNRQSSAKNPRALLDLALRHYNNGLPDEAEKLCLQVQAQSPSNPDNLNLLGIIAAAKGERGLAIDYLGRAIKINGTVADYHNNLGKILREVGRLDNAQQHLERAIALKPDYAAAYNNLGAVFFARENYKEALTRFERALELQPDDVFALNNLGGYHYKFEDYDAAQNYYERLLAQQPDNENILYHLALIRFYQTPTELWGAICQQTLACPLLSQRHGFDILVRLAVHNWIRGDHQGLFDALFKTEEMAKILFQQKDKTTHSAQAYRNFLVHLYDYVSANPIPASRAENMLAVIGDSHCLSYAHTNLLYGGVAYTLVPHLNMGCKAWHLGRQDNNAYIKYFNALLDRLPAESLCLVTSGEIDCRYNDGIIPHVSKHGGDLDAVVVSTAQKYASFVGEAMRRRQLKPLFLNVPAPNIKELRKFDESFSSHDEEQLVHVIRLFNECLARDVLAQGFEVIDVYGLTADETGRSDGTHHIDSHHLKPYVLAKAMEKEKNVPRLKGMLRPM